MSLLDEIGNAKGPLAAGLAAGVNTLSENQTVTFTKYVRVVLPLDGFVFWVKADLLSESALLNASQFNTVGFNDAPVTVTAAPTIQVQGSLHYAQDNNQNEDETAARNEVIFTALSSVVDFNEIGSSVLYIARLGPDGVPYAFNSRAPFYYQADLYHYMGTAVFPGLLSQIIDHPSQLDQSLVVSNSLPLWLSFNGYEPPYPGLTSPFTLYPSFLVPQNLRPPYGSVHIEPTSTRYLQSAPVLTSSLSSSQLARDIVRVTTYGIRNDGILGFMNFVYQYSMDTDNLGIMEIPTVRDEKRTQSEMNMLAMKKSIEFEVSYYQGTSRDIARQLIKKVLVHYDAAL